MRTGLFWLLSFGGFAAMSLLCGILVWPQLVAAWPSIEEKIDRFRRLPPFAKLVLLLCVGGLVVYGGGKNVSTNNGEAVSRPLQIVGRQPLRSGQETASPLPVTPEDIARGWQLWEVRTNCNISYTMPEDATLATNWWVRGAYEDVKPFDFGSWRFPFGTNEYSSLWAFSWGKVRFALADTNTEIVAVGAPMSAVPYRSRLWSATDANGARVVTWENFALNRDINTPVNAQIELRANGDFITRSNEVETVYRRVDPEDYDGDGWENGDDTDPYNWEPFSDYFCQELPEGANTNAYCWVDIRPRWNSWIVFYGDGPSDLEDPYFWGEAGVTYHVQLLIGKTYFVESSQPVDMVGRSSSSVEVDGDGTCELEIVWPVSFTAVEGNGKNFRMIVRPAKLNGVFDWCYSCCSIVEEGIGFRYTCNGGCGCSGCQAEGEYRYEGYSLLVCGGNCGCPYHDGPDETAGVSVAFSESVILFEQTYTNSYGQSVSGQTTRSRLTCVVHGGVHGGNLSVSVSGLDKLTTVGGGALPTGNVFIAPQETRTYEIDFMGQKPSEHKGDIVVTAMFVEQDTSETHSDEAMLTCVRIMTNVICRWIPWTERKEIGVGEFAYVYAQPADDEIELVVSGCEHDENRWVYHALRRAGSQTVNAAVSGSILPITFQTLEPEGLSAEVFGCDWGDQAGVAGNFRGLFEVHVLPTNVSFTALQTREIGCVATDPTGIFSTESYRDWLDHSLHGANEWHGLNEKNSFFDQVSFAVVGNWYGQASSFTWPIPNVWKVDDSDEIPIPHDSGFDQRFEIDVDGTSRIKKFHWILEQSTNLNHSTRKE